MRIQTPIILLVVGVLLGSCRALTFAPATIENKTVIKSEIVTLGAPSFTTCSSGKPKRIRSKADRTTYTIAVNKELIIQCKKLVLNRNIQFNGTDVTVVIEYEEVQDNFHTVNASLGAKGLLRLEKKKFQ